MARHDLVHSYNEKEGLVNILIFHQPRVMLVVFKNRRPRTIIQPVYAAQPPKRKPSLRGCDSHMVKPHF